MRRWLSRWLRHGMAFCLLVGLAGAALAAQTRAQSAGCETAPPPRLIVNERGRVSLHDPRPLNLRDGAGTDSRVLAQIPASGVFYVLAGPNCGQHYAWFQVEYNGIAGWIAEGDETAYYVEIYPPGW